MNFPTGDAARPLYAIGIVLVALGAIALVGVVIFRGGDLGSPQVLEVLGFAATIITLLAGFLGVHNSVSTVGANINGRMSQLVDTTSSNAFQAGQTAGPGAPVPPAPSTMVPIPGTLTGATGATGPAGPQGPPGPPGGSGG